jgi:tripartite-type tricarboxylate transporter receptor subunit TctC
MRIRRLCLALAAFACCAHVDHLAQAQASFPNRPIRFIVTSPPGGANDILNRIVGAKFSDVVGQPVLIDNRAGASGFVAAEMVAKSPADGTTLLMGTEATLVVNPLFFPKVPYNPERDFAPVTITAVIQHVLLVNPSVPAASVQELIALARARPGRLNYASSGNGSAFHLGMEMFKRMAGVDLVHVPFKGSALSVNAMLAGDVQVMLNGVPGAMPYVRAGKLRALAVAGAARSPLVPDLPTVGETLPGFEFGGWFGAVAPAATPRPAIQKLHEAFARALHSPEVGDRLAAQGYEVVASTPEEMAGRMRSESQKWARVIRESGIRPD